jgi:CheY-like chemotaxis protein
MTFANTIHSSGNDLLMLINDILDLSKIESGTVLVDAGELRLDDLRSFVERTFRHMAENKNLDFLVRFDAHLPRTIVTDVKRLQQIIKNLLSNAFKFTHHGQVTLTVEPVTTGWNPENEELSRAPEVIALAVADTGIGIPADKQQIIFEAFQQADGSTNRKYGGTGLGLAISRELSRLLGGEIRLVSNPGRGSVFVLYLPSTYIPPRPARKAIAAPESAPAAPAPVRDSAPTVAETPTLVEPAPVEAALEELPNELGDDRADIRPGDRVLLIVENDLGFARFLLDSAREQGFKGIVSTMGAPALTLAREHKPDALTLDIFLPDIAGWRVLDRLKNDVALRHIPVCVISTDEARDRALANGALAFLAKPIQNADLLNGVLQDLRDYISRPTKRLLVVEPTSGERNRIVESLNLEDLHVSPVAELSAAKEMLREQSVDCMVFGPSSHQCVDDLLAGINGHQSNNSRLPVILFGENSDHDLADWKRLSDTCTVRRAQSPERLLDLSTFFLHCAVAKLPESKRQLLLDLHQSDKPLTGKRVLIVDDDIRNIFALSAVLEEHDMVIVSADNGRDAIRILSENLDIDIVLMDIMMPEMDGLETMRVIRQNPALRNLPIVAVTAKAMKGDREKCIEAGAWDYLSKPVNAEQMLSVLRAWLHR